MELLYSKVYCKQCKVGAHLVCAGFDLHHSKFERLNLGFDSVLASVCPKCEEEDVYSCMVCN